MSSNNRNSGNMFEIATKAKLRFPSSKGPASLTCEDLWDIPPLSRDDFNLDVIAKTVNRQLKAISEESFVRTARNPAQGKLELMLDILKYIIETKQIEEDEAKQRAENKVKKEKILKALAEKQDGKLSEMSEKELLKQLNELDT